MIPSIDYKYGKFKKVLCQTWMYAFHSSQILAIQNPHLLLDTGLHLFFLCWHYLMYSNSFPFLVKNILPVILKSTSNSIFLIKCWPKSRSCIHSKVKASIITVVSKGSAIPTRHLVSNRDGFGGETNSNTYMALIFSTIFLCARDGSWACFMIVTLKYAARLGVTSTTKFSLNVQIGIFQSINIELSLVLFVITCCYYYETP